MRKLLITLSILLLTAGIYGCGSTTSGEAVCGNGTCELDGSENTEVCPDDCAVLVTDLSFVDDNIWATTSPENDCLADLDGNMTISFTLEPVEAFEDNYAVVIEGLSLNISRNDDNLCFILYGPTGSPPYCDYTSACEEGHIAASGCSSVKRGIPNTKYHYISNGCIVHRRGTLLAV